MSALQQRGHQMFPVLDVARIETALRFASGPERHFAPREMLYDHGQRGAPSWLVLSGSVDVTRRDGLDREAPVVTFGAGQFTGEINQLAGRHCPDRTAAPYQSQSTRDIHGFHVKGQRHTP